jgi:hypothetical protein
MNKATLTIKAVLIDDIAVDGKIEFEGNKQVMAKLIAGALQNDLQFKELIFEALINACNPNILKTKRYEKMETKRGGE